MKEFVFAAKTVVDEQGEPVEESEEPTLPFKIDGVEYQAYRPAEGQLILIMAAMSGYYQDAGESAATIINFFIELLTEEGRHLVTKKLMDRKDPFGLEQLIDVLEYIVEAWTNTPTSGPSGSTPSPENTGPKSTASVPSAASTPSPSPQLASATSSTPG